MEKSVISPSSVRDERRSRANRRWLVTNSPIIIFVPVCVVITADIDHCSFV
jgi:hypothetical protein